MRSLLVVCLALAPRLSWGEDCVGKAVELSPQVDFHSLGPCIQWHEVMAEGDPDTIDAVRALPESSWKALKRTVFVHGATNHALWLKFSFRWTGEAGKRILSLGHPLLDSVDAFVYVDDQWVQKARMGDEVENEGRYPGSRLPAFELPKTLGESIEVWLRVQSTSTLSFPVVIQTTVAFEETERIQRMLFGGYLGVAIAMLIFNGIVFFLMKSHSTLLFVFMSISMSCYALSLEGVGEIYLWGQNSWFKRDFAFTAVPLACIMSLLFTWSFVGVTQVPKSMKIWMGALLTSSAFIFLISAFTRSNYPEKINANSLNTMITAFSIVWISFKTARSGFKPAWYFFIGWLVTAIGIFVDVGRMFGLLPVSLFVQWFWKGGQCLEFILLSIAVVVRLRFIHESNLTKLQKVEKESAEKEWQLKTSKMRELGHMAIVLGDRINSPLNAIVLALEELEEPGEDLGKKEARHSIERAALRIREEIGALAPFKEFAPSDALHIPLGAGNAPPLQSIPPHDTGEGP